MNYVSNKFNINKNIVGNYEVATIAQMVTLGLTALNGGNATSWR
jgi:hypothetical protein